MVDQKLIEYVKGSLAQGKSKEEIYKELLNQGLTIEAIQYCFESYTAEEEKKDNLKKVIRIIVNFGAILIGTGIFAIIAANWAETPRVGKIGIILVSMLASYVSGWRLKEKLNSPKTGEALILLGTIIYGAGIFLVAQMFNIRVNWPDGFILWMIGSIVMAFAIESYLLLYLAVLLGFIALIGYPGTFIGFGLGHNSFLFTSSFLLLIATVLTFMTGWKIRKKILPELKEY